MTLLSRFCLSDLWSVGRVNIDAWTEAFSTSFYLFYAMSWPELNWTVRSNSGVPVSYILGSVCPNHLNDDIAHVAAVSVCAEGQRLGIASTLMTILETVADARYAAKCVSLYVRPTNEPALALYAKLGYKLYRRIVNYYDHVHEDGLDLRHSLARDTERAYEVALPAPIPVSDLSDE